MGALPTRRLPRAALALALLAAGALTATAVAVPSGGAAYACSGKQVTLFDDTNGAAVDDGGSAPTFTTKGAWCVTYLQTYHWHGGGGVAPGSLGLARVSGGAGLAAAIGPFPATASAGQNNAPNVNWYVDVPQAPPPVIDGTYRCTDSSPGTLSSNSTSAGRGFCIVYAVPAVRGGGQAAPTTAAATTAPTTTTAPGKCSLPQGAPVPPDRPCADLYVEDSMSDLGYWGAVSVVVGRARKLPAQAQEQVRKKVVTVRRTLAVAVDGWIYEEALVGNNGDDPGGCNLLLVPGGTFACARGAIQPGRWFDYAWWWRARKPGVYTRTLDVVDPTVSDPVAANDGWHVWVRVYGVVNVARARFTAHGVSGRAAATPSASAPGGGSPAAAPGKLPAAAPGLRLTGPVDPQLAALDHVEIAILRRDADTRVTPLAIESGSCNWLTGADGTLARTASLLGVCVEPHWLRADGTTEWSFPLAHPLAAGSYVLLVRTVNRAGVGSSTFAAARHTQLELTVR